MKGLSHVFSVYGHKQVDRLVLVSRVSVMALMTVHETVNPNERFLTVLVCARWKVRRELETKHVSFIGPAVSARENPVQ